MWALGVPAPCFRLALTCRSQQGGERAELLKQACRAGLDVRAQRAMLVLRQHRLHVVGSTLGTLKDMMLAQRARLELIQAGAGRGRLCACM